MKTIKMDIIDVMGMEGEEWHRLIRSAGNFVVLSEFSRQKMVNVIIPAPIKRIWSFFPKFSFTHKLIEEKGEDLFSIERSIKNKIRRKGRADPRVFKGDLLDGDVVNFSTYDRSPFGMFISKLVPYSDLDVFLGWLQRNIDSLIDLSCEDDLYKRFSVLDSGAFSSIGFEKDVWAIIGASDSDRRYIKLAMNYSGYSIEDVVKNLRGVLRILSVMEDDFKNLSVNEFIGKYYFSIEMSYFGELKRNFNIPFFIDDSGVAMSLIEKRVDIVCGLNIPHFYDAIFNKKDLGMNVIEQFDYLLKDVKNNRFHERLAVSKDKLKNFGFKVKESYGDIFGF
ncbi:hypothetical protein [Vandammella animalimorsus]|uniref:hypothetical protein n=1 Tax=Vandammella animalimorsus TaxID=2029117 RepID=UPI0011775071|nr:hypothetical protein [Vandammella animalimorsus]